MQGSIDGSVMAEQNGTEEAGRSKAPEGGGRYPGGYRTPSESVVETTKSLKYEDINGYGRLFGGRLMEWIDETAGLAAVRHCCNMVTTAAVDNLQFKAGAGLGDIIVIIARVTYVGHTSVEVRVDTYVEDVETGTRRPINRAFLTEVCVDADGRPVPVRYGLMPQTEGEKADYEGAQRRIALRRQRREEGF